MVLQTQCTASGAGFGVEKKDNETSVVPKTSIQDVACTYARAIGEALRLKWTDVNSENSTIILNEPEKHCNARIFRISPKLMRMLQARPKKSERIFTTTRSSDKQHIFKVQRDKLAEKLGNPPLSMVTFHTLPALESNDGIP